VILLIILIILVEHSLKILNFLQDEVGSLELGHNLLLVGMYRGLMQLYIPHIIALVMALAVFAGV
jgi:hypothetical protein